jgi:hypothetical protein
MIHRRLPIVLALALAVASCVPKPHVVHLRAAVQGTVLEDGKPVPGIELFLAKSVIANEPCAETAEVIPVSPDGRFSWPAVQESRLMDSLLNPVHLRGKVTMLCIRHPSRGVLEGTAMVSRQDRAQSFRLSCDVARPLALGSRGISTMVRRGQHCDGVELKD